MSHVVGPMSISTEMKPSGILRHKVVCKEIPVHRSIELAAKARGLSHAFRDTRPNSEGKFGSLTVYLNHVHAVEFLTFEADATMDNKVVQRIDRILENAVGYDQVLIDRRYELCAPYFDELEPKPVHQRSPFFENYFELFEYISKDYSLHV